MSEIVIYHSPGACSRVTLNALEEAGASYEDRPINVMAGQQKTADYLAVNPKGKVPAILFDGRLLTENAAILLFLDKLYPAARLVPPEHDPVAAANHASDLVWCSSTLHPLTRSVRMPSRLTDEDPAAVHAKGLQQFAQQAAVIEQRLAGRPWWNGEQWSIVDVYIFWNCDTARAGGFDLSSYPEIRAHAARVRARPSFERALAREQAALDRLGVSLPPGTTF